jgi:calcineurin-like phosphoesterase family protein
MNYDKPKIFFTSDLHLGHKNILTYSKRPFGNIDEMEESLIKNWNSVVGKNDSIYVLGDFSFMGARITTIFHKFNGNKFLIKGNHDDKPCLRLPWVWVRDTHQLRIDDDKIWLSHYAHRTWPCSFHNSYHLFGHSHASMPPFGRSMDVGVDCWNYTPISWEDVKARLVNVTNNESSDRL